MCVYVQTVEGKAPQAVTGSEMAAMFDLHIVPALRQTYPADQQEFDELRKAFAAELKVPDEWQRIRIPSYLSLDSAPYHPWVRQKLSLPRLSDEEQMVHVREAVKQGLGGNLTCPTGWLPKELRPVEAPAPQPAPPPAPTRALAPRTAAFLGRVQVQDIADYEAEPEDEQEAAEQLQAEARQQEGAQLDAMLAERKEKGQDIVGDCLRELARTNVDMQVLFPQQFMPLTQVTPDIHSPVEHAVQRVKAHLKEKIWLNLTSDDLFMLVTYQRWVQEAVELKLNHADGPRQIKSSIAKQKCICQVLAADKGVNVEIEHVFGKSRGAAGNKKSTHTVVGTGGGWIRDYRLT